MATYVYQATLCRRHKILTLQIPTMLILAFSAPMLDSCSSSWEGISYPTSCQAGFSHHQREFFPPSSDAHSRHVISAFLMDHWTFHLVPSLLTDFSSIGYVGNMSLSLPLSLFLPLGFQDEKMESFLWCWCSITVCLGSLLHRGQEGMGWRSRKSLPDQPASPVLREWGVS